MPSAPLVREHLDRILCSPTFAKADRLRAFLRFVVDRTLAGEQDTIKEYSIALEVCGRSSTFDARIDPIVRVDASRLRARLDAYYRQEGGNDEIRIHLPKGSCVPTMKSVVPPTAPRSAGDCVTRDRSSSVSVPLRQATPVLWNLSSARSGPAWHVVQRARVRNSTNPRLALSPSARAVRAG